MSTRETHGASSSKAHYTYQYHVFLSFRNKDTGKIFSDHLYAALLNAGIYTFRDDDEVEGGVRNQTKFQKAIEESRIVIIVFSKDYAFSEWCLNELVYIVESKNDFGYTILPVFYDVDPSQVRKQTGRYGEAFFKHEERFNEETEVRRKERMEKIQRWRVALKHVADLGGMVLQNQADGYEAKFIQEIVSEVGRKLDRNILNVALYPIGIDSRVKDINLWLQDGSADVDVLGICGMGGIGKTTIAKTAYNLNFDKFEGGCFLASIREASEQYNGLVHLQRQLLSSITRKKVKKIYNVDEGIVRIQEAICNKRILLVLDDVDDADQLNAVLGVRDWFYPGSKIIITSRDEHLLEASGVFKIFMVKELNKRESLRLFSLHAFGTDNPPEDYEDLSRNVVYHCRGNALALKVVGSSLCDRSVEVWESALRKLEVIPDNKILEKLRISYDSLPDDHDQNLFLDIVCFLTGKDRDFVTTILDGCGYCSIVGIQNLIDRCLVILDSDEKLRVHQLVQDMGREIIRQESPWEPGKRSRIWRHRDSFSVLKAKTGTETVKGFALDMQMLKGLKSAGTNADVKTKWCHPGETPKQSLREDYCLAVKRQRLIFQHSVNTTLAFREDADFEPDAFSRMWKLQMLHLSHVKLNGGYDNFPKKIKWLCLLGCHLRYIPNDLPLESVVALDMRHSSLEFVWKGTRLLRLLKILNLGHCHHLLSAPDFSGLPNLKRLILKDCRRLVELHESVGDLEGLNYLNLRDCKNFRKFPANFYKLKSLEKLIISGCSKLATSAMELGKLQSLAFLHADGVALNQLGAAPGPEKSWRELFHSVVSKLKRTPDTISFSLSSLSGSLLSLSLSNCNLSEIDISVDLSSLSLLRYLNLSENPIRSLPQSIICLSTLKDLWLDSCPRLQSLPELPQSLIDLKTVNCTSLESITNLPNLLQSLFLDVSGCEKLSEVEGLFKLEPIGNFSAEMINSLGHLRLASDSIRNDQVELFNKMTQTKGKLPVQGLYEFGIFSTCFPGNEFPSWFSDRSEENLVSLKVSSRPNMKILGLNICIVYARCSERKYQFWTRNQHDHWYTYYIKISNSTKGLKWIYCPTFIGIPGAKEDMTFLCHWKLGNQLILETGDQVNVSVVGWSYTFQMKEFGASLLYDDIQEEKQLIESTNAGGLAGSFNLRSSDSNVFENQISAYQLATHAYFFSHPEYFVVKGRSLDNSDARMVLYDHLFEDDRIVGFTREEGEQQDDSDFDYSMDDDFDEAEAEAEVEMLLDW